MPAGDGGSGHVADDQAQPFMLEATGFRGRLLRLGPAVDQILERHDYPEPVAAILAELLTLAALVSSLLKHDGILTLQVQGNGPLGLAIADVTHDGRLRGYAQFDRDAFAANDRRDAEAHSKLADIFGEGYLVYTLDQAGDDRRYQGIVELIGDTMADCMQHYFRQSEQVNAGLKLTAERSPHGWRAGALLIQQLPEEPDGKLRSVSSHEEDDWRRALVLMSSCTDEELLDVDLPPNDLLYRLFHEEGVRVFPPLDFEEACRCSRQKIERTLQSLPREELESLKEDDKMVVTCQFCNRDYHFEESDLAALDLG